MVVDVIIPAFNEEQSIANVIRDLPKHLVRHIVIANNGSTDETRAIALNAGAWVIDQPLKGYGNACLKALEHIENQPQPPDIIVFIDGDFSDYPQQLPKLIEPILHEQYDLVIGSRVLGKSEKGSLMPQQRFGNALACTLIRLIYGHTFTDLGPFRAIRFDSLLKLSMEDKNFGWTIEMQIKAVKTCLRCKDVPVDYRKRIGQSKVSGTLSGSIRAGYKILWTLFKYAF